MEQIPLEADCVSASKEMPCFLFNTEVYYSAHKSQSPVPEPYESTPFHPVSLRSILILSFHFCLGLLHCIAPSDFPAKICTHFSYSMPATCSMHLFLHSLIILITSVTSTNYKIPCYAIFSDLLSLRPSYQCTNFCLGCIN
jgi:hypothetical protein